MRLLKWDHVIIRRRATVAGVEDIGVLKACSLILGIRMKGHSEVYLRHRRVSSWSLVSAIIIRSARSRSGRTGTWRTSCMESLGRDLILGVATPRGTSVNLLIGGCNNRSCCWLTAVPPHVFGPPLWTLHISDKSGWCCYLEGFKNDLVHSAVRLRDWVFLMNVHCLKFA
jgi:hypothetical protein